MKNNLIFISGFLFGIAGWTIEFFPNNEFIFRTIIIIAAILLLLFSINFKLNRDDSKIIYYFLIYLMATTLSVFINEDSIQYIIREILLVVLVFCIISLLTDFIKFKIFISGLIISSSTLITYYFFKIDFANFFLSYYRFSTELGSTGIGEIGLMLGVIYFNLIFKNNSKKESIVYLLLFVMSLVIILATKSRTSIILLCLSVFLYLYFEKKIKILILSIILLGIFSVINFNKIELILRVNPVVGYVGNNNITNLTGRTDIWAHGVELWQSSPLIGVGSSNAVAYADGHEAKLHNAYLQMIVSIGLFGFIPIIILFIRAFFKFKKSNITVFRILFLVGIISSFIESSLFNFGSPGNFLFLLSFIFLLQSNNLKSKELL